jgi:hypothetical protein
MRALLFGLLVVGGVGCAQFQPVGPLAKTMGAPKGRPPSDKDAPPDPVTVPAQRPTPPALLITPGEVTAENPTAAAQKLMSEFEYDRKTMPAAPKTAEISVIKGGVPQ